MQYNEAEMQTAHLEESAFITEHILMSTFSVPALFIWMICTAFIGRSQVAFYLVDLFENVSRQDVDSP